MLAFFITETMKTPNKTSQEALKEAENKKDLEEIKDIDLYLKEI